MITGFVVENFKGIREPLEIDIRPITLFFGPNSVGKSTLLHAMLYAHDVFHHHSLNAEQTEIGGTSVDLGGFQQFVHGHDAESNPVRLTFRMKTSDWGDDAFLDEMPDVAGDLGYDAGFDTFALFDSMDLTIEIRWSAFKSEPYVKELTASIDDRPLVVVQSDPLGRQVSATFYSRHSKASLERAWRTESGEDLPEGDEDAPAILSRRTCLQSALERLQDFALGASTDDAPDVLTFYLERLADAWIDPREHRRIPFVVKDEIEEDDLPLADVASQIMDGATRLLFPAIRDVQEFLENMRYLGPLREVPRRFDVAKRRFDGARWSIGLGAWDYLETADVSFVEAVSAWLSEPDRLNAGYLLDRKQFKELDLADPVILKLVTGRAADELEGETSINLSNLPTKTRLVIVPVGSDLQLRPNDVGVGISQVVPVVVTALEGMNRLIAIEQPELHLHPRLQADLADLFIAAAKGQAEQRFLLETHSELIPRRIMRRIRESSEGKTHPDRPPISRDDVAIYYVQPEDGRTTAYLMELDEDGSMLTPWPSGFFEEGYRETLP